MWNVEGELFNETERNRGSQSASKAILLKDRPEAKGYLLKPFRIRTHLLQFSSFSTSAPSGANGKIILRNTVKQAQAEEVRGTSILLFFLLAVYLWVIEMLAENF